MPHGLLITRKILYLFIIYIWKDSYRFSCFSTAFDTRVHRKGVQETLNKSEEYVLRDWETLIKECSNEMLKASEASFFRVRYYME